MATRTIRTNIYKGGKKIESKLKRDVIDKDSYKKKSKEQQSTKKMTRGQEREQRQADRRARWEEKYESKHLKRTMPESNYTKWEERLKEWRTTRDRLRM